MSSRDEIVTIVDEENRVVGSAPRHWMRALRLPHRSTYILVFNSKGELFVQKRTRSKDVYPGYYDLAAGGVVLSGEDYEEGARRELKEELGIANIPLRRLFDFYYEDPSARVWGAAFSAVFDGEIALQEEEIESGEFLSVEEILKLEQSRLFTPDGMYVFRQYLRVQNLD